MNEAPRFVNIPERARFRDDKMAKNNLFESERMFCDLYCLQPGQVQKPHSHDGSDKIYVVLTGEVVASVAGEERTLGPGSAAWSAPGEEHALRNEAAEPAQVLVFMTPKP